MGKMVYQNGNRVYIHSVNAPSKAGLTPWRNPLHNSINEVNVSELATYQTPLLNRLQAIKLNGKSIENLDEMQMLNSMVDGIVEGWNDAVNNTEVSDLMGLIAGVSKELSTNSVSNSSLDELLGKIQNIFTAITDASSDVLMCALANATYSPGSQIGRYFESIKQQYEGQMISVTQGALAKAEQIAGLFVKLSENEASYNSLSGTMRKFFGSKLGEPMVKYIFNQAGIYADKQITKTLVEGRKSPNVKVISSAENVQQQAMPSPQIQANNFFITSNTYTREGRWVVSGQLGFTGKWISLPESARGAKGKKPAQFSIVSNSPVVKYINELARGITETNNYMNAFFRNSDADIVEVVEKTAIISGLSKSNNPLGVDTTMFLVINGKFYSVYSIIAQALQSQDWRSSFSISYAGGRLGEGDNQWQPPQTRNLLSAETRNQIALAALQRAKYNIYMKYAALQAYS